MSEIDELRDAVADVLRARSTAEALEAAERDGWAPDVWSALAEGGFATVAVPESAGGSGGSVAQACAVLEACGAASAPVPVAETGLLAGRLLASAGLSVPEGPVTTVASPGVSFSDGVLAGAVDRVPWGRSASLALVAGSSVVVVAPGSGVVTPGRNIAGEPRDHVDLTGVRPLESAPVGPDAVEDLRRRGALSRAALIAGAARAVLDLTVRYTGEREQFGRPVAKFPAVAAHLVQIAEQAEIAAMAARSAAEGAGEEGEPAALDVAAAFSVASDAAGAVATAAHQATGAMGMTREFGLGVLTRRLWSWRDEWGGGAAWAAELGRSLAAGGADAFWPTISRGLVASS
ncbi:acyl-CoA dehydrogenase family protein [Actinomycetospora termitidis]|uniref:Acyl-CoA dehydrogenase family protein n=1 Tax=Actinomycetospora termitidis TaxID=3053470 RepID=A0ABT7MFZ4_9PSEU|nr:acyl-CoA dehydrogenase family protein [Actinomycetospora sp. Odt1-22]MDL5159074.1 acyl-CoA dehydrogenase family protein [Actinomycetospora sp. Odt1-22]